MVAYRLLPRLSNPHERPSLGNSWLKSSCVLWHKAVVMCASGVAPSRFQPSSTHHSYCVDAYMTVVIAQSERSRQTVGDREIGLMEKPKS